MLALKTTQGAIWLIFSKFFGRMVDFITLLVLARVLTPADFGLVALATSLVVVVDTVLEVPVIQALLRFKHISKSHLDTGFALGVLRGAAVAALVLAATWPFVQFYGDDRLIPVMLCLSLAPIFRSLASPRMVTFAKDLSFRPTVITEFAGKIFAFTCAITLALLGAGYWAIVANSVGWSIASTIASYVLAPYWPRFSLAHFSSFSNFVGWFSAAQIVSALNWQMDRFLLGRVIDRALLGKYTVAGDLAALPSQSLIGPAMAPIMAAFSRITDDRERLKVAFLKAARFVMLISLPTAIGISVTADLSVALLLGPQWQDTAWFLKWLVLAALPMPYFQTLHSLCLAIDRPNTIFRINFIELAIRAVVLLTGYLLFSLDGVVAGRVVLSALMFIFYLHFAREMTGISIAAQVKNIWKEILAGVALAMLTVLLRGALAPYHLAAIVELALTMVAGGLVYGGALYMLGVRLSMGGSRVGLTDRP